MVDQFIEIREAHTDDTPTIHRLGENVEEFHTSDQAPNFWPEKVLRNCITKGDVYFFVAVSGVEVVGFIIANLNRSLSKVLIENIFVKPAFRGRGIGSNLAKRVIECAKSDQYQFVSVLTPPDDVAAIKTYETAGFSKGEIFLWLDVA
jgi:ribosomal protein S18 acetylase RimI-like enzyme